MSHPAEVTAKIAEQGGAAVAVGSYVVWAGDITQWLNHNSAAVVATCGIVGALVSVVGLLTNLHYQEKRFQYQLRQKSRRE
ncbi:MAG: hypothetical protein JWM78_1652 [Verrucomicrobiaceae bacterium]|nr:hypothetical protein [Verrucomicrobiaceae bacterium]